MNGAEIAGLILALLVMAVGIAGSILPVLPGPPLVLLAAVIHRLCLGSSGASYLVLGVMTAVTLLSLLLDYLASVYGAKRLGATWRGMTGAVVGAVVGMFFSIPGILLGPFVGAIAGEMIGGREWRPAAKAGAGAVIGVLVGALGKLACALAMTGLWVFSAIRAGLASSV